MHSPELKKLRHHAREIFLAGLSAVDPERAVLRALRRDGALLHLAGETFDLNKFNRVLVLGAGKASPAMAAAVESRLADRIADGLIVTKDGHGRPLQKCQVVEAGHPVPDSRGEQAARKLLQLAETAQINDLVICLISGGGSALLPLPAGEITLADEQQVTALLLSHGVTIHETNTVRKHISRLKGGQLAAAVYPATLVTLVVSDVIGDPLDIIASGPTVPDPSKFSDAERVLVLYGVWPKLPARVRDYITAGCRGHVPETPKPGDPIFTKNLAHIVACNADAISACERHARSLGYNTMVLSHRVQGEAREIGRFYAALLHHVVDAGQPIAAPACILAGGETTVTLRNPGGKGGRNQEMALSVALDIDGLPNCVFLSAGTDGTDGPTDAAGAFADGWTIAHARTRGMRFFSSYLRDNDSYNFFNQLGDLFITGPTGTNVMDVQIMLVS
ncbi:MAG: glycerate kinase [candidate division KSB1 bacterium]|nr:glycerate kinase [candidate division KSB1 bacterium]MDZ7274411.1 glycerate kinase [candidate division KSB1 bacterium]MDZ7284927.1 glycerate kinase [candidate division KSB1 bacterium]MDZ7297652.1 glycerate kinase [candidate division KSB1 bacterium]MDZ7308615.1 glycerate kinase [candidate division KSB1 bacterium]